MLPHLVLVEGLFESLTTELILFLAVKYPQEIVAIYAPLTWIYRMSVYFPFLFVGQVHHLFKCSNAGDDPLAN